MYTNLTPSLILFVSYLAEKDGLDGEDLLGIVQYVEELRHYFPLVKERLKFKKLILMNAEPRDGASSSSVR